MIPAVLDHLWQSTLFLCAAGLLTLLLRRQGAHTRYWLWFAASVKFLVPFALLVSLGSELAPHTATRDVETSTTAPPMAIVAQRLTVPFAGAASMQSTPTFPWQEFAIMAWVLGALLLVVVWAARWRQVRALVRESRPLAIAAPIPVRPTPSSLEPGLVGIVRPVLLVPEGLAEHLSVDETRSILAHELTHLRRRDNLTYAIHRLCQTVFWFYPPTWWLGKRLILERERACDEAVLASGHEPQVYGEGILKVCRFYIAAPTMGTSGVAGPDLKRRVQAIMEGCETAPMNTAQKLLVGVIAVVSVALPLCFGLLSPPIANAQVARAAASTPADIARQDYEQSRPQTEIPFEPKNFDKYVGYYQLAPMFFAHVFREGDRYFFKPTGDHPREVFPESATKFFATQLALQVGFVIDAQGSVSGLVLYQDGFLRPAKRVAEGVAVKAEAELQERIKNNIPSPGTEAVQRRLIAGWERGQPDYNEMGPVLAYANRLNLPKVMAIMQQMGSFQSMVFERVAPNGWDVYVAEFSHGRLECSISPLSFSSDGKVTGAVFSVIP